MNTNYQLELDRTLKALEERGERPTLLLHSCCGPCSSYVLDYLSDYFDITVLYYNPCIDPEEEYELRKGVQKGLIQRMNARGKNIRYRDLPYDHLSFLDAVTGHEADREGGARCALCFEQRLRKAAETAREGDYDWFCTTLTVSPHKNAQVLNHIGQVLGEEYGVPFLPSDFKKRDGYKKSIELSREYCLYRQNYCGCEFSSRPEDADAGTLVTSAVVSRSIAEDAKGKAGTL
ncbi:MAG: epoxyqueuosine reductase QueH [Clostridia bacterium]|nr:epoxyqueuosine reductase QueH [Clostridia bacterium]